MDNKKYAEITNAVYKLIEFFPEEEPLRAKIKEKALQILENLVVFSLPDNPHPSPLSKAKAASRALEDIEVVKSYLMLGKSRGWVDSLNSLIVFREYDKIKEEIKPALAIMQRAVAGEQKSQPKQRKPKVSIITAEKAAEQKDAAEDVQTLVSERQEKIIEILKNKQKVQVADLKSIMPDVSKRTLRRDLDVLLKMGKVQRMGEWNQIFYQIHKNPISSSQEIGQDTQKSPDNGRTLLMS